jgi:hypothetical protein
MLQVGELESWLRCCFHMPETRAPKVGLGFISSRLVQYRHLFLLQQQHQDHTTF